VVLYYLSSTYIECKYNDIRERYRRRNFFSTIIVFVAAAAIALLWAHTLKAKGTFLGLLGAGLAVAPREPLLSLAGRLAVFSGHMYTAGDRIELQQMTGASSTSASSIHACLKSVHGFGVTSTAAAFC